MKTSQVVVVKTTSSELREKVIVNFNLVAAICTTSRYFV